MHPSFLGLAFRLRTAVLLLSPSLAPLLLGGCGDLFGSHKSAAVTADGGACLRDPRETLLAALDQSCSLSSQCPHGAFCDLEIGGRCNFQCLDDTECASGKTCDCFGRCVAAGGAGGAGGAPASDPACPKNLTLLNVALPATFAPYTNDGLRTCQFDDECPNGSNCDPQYGRCARDCFNDNECAFLGFVGTVCDCRGKCVLPNAPPAPRPPAPATLASITLSPPVINIPKPAGAIPVKPQFAAQAVQIRVDSPTGSVSPAGVVSGPAIALDIRGERFVEPSCGFNRWCSLSTAGFTWTKEGDRFIGTQTIQIRPSADQPASGEVGAKSWRVEVHSAGLVAPATLVVQYSDRAASTIANGWPLVTQKTNGIGYSGVVRLTVQDEPGTASADGKPRETTLAIPVVALTWGAPAMTLYDPSRVLSPSGILAFKWAATTSNYYQDFISSSAVASGVIRAGVNHLDSANRVREDPDTKALVGTLKSQVILRSSLAGELVTFDQTLRFNLLPDPTVKACSTSVAGTNFCPPGLTCNSGFCTTGPDKVAISSSPPTTAGDPITVGHPGLDSWASSDRMTIMRNAIGTAPSTVRSSEFPLCAISAVGLGGSTSRSLSRLFGTPPGTLGGGDERFSGDQFCDEPGIGRKIQMAVPLPWLQYLRTSNQNVAPPALANQKWPASQVLGACLSDLGATVPRLGTVLTPDALGPDYFSKDEADPAAKRCFSPGNFYPALVLALDSGRSMGNSGKLYQHLMRQWLEMHSFIAREATEELKLDAVLAGASDAEDASPNKLSYDGILDVMERGLWLPLSEMTRARYDSFDVAGGDLANPDYRQTAQPTLEAKPEWEQPAGFAPALLEAAAAYLEVVEAHLAKVEVDTYEASLGGVLAPERMRALRRFGDAIRITTAAQGIAAWVYRRATSCAPGAFPCNPPWQKRWREAMDLFTAQRSRTFVAGSRVGLVRNPLGIGEDDVPLYFGDPTGQTGRFFASSDYLVEKWAAPAVAEARSNFDDARAAWIQKRNSTIQDELLGADRERRLEDLGRLYGKPVIDNCGLATYRGVTVEAKDVFGIVDGSPLTVGNCFVDQSCAVGPTGMDTTDIQQLLNSLPQSGAKAAIQYQLCLKAYTEAHLTMTQIPAEVQQCLNAGPDAWDVLSSASFGDGFTCAGALIQKTLDVWRDNGQGMAFADVQRQAAEACDARYGHASALQIPEFDAGCYRGRMGEAMSRLNTAKQETAVALAHLETTEVAANEKVKQCLQMESDGQLRILAEQVLNKVRDNWAQTKNIARDVVQVTDTAHGIAQGAAMGGPIGAVLGGLDSLFGSGARNVQQEVDDQLRLAEADYQQLVSRQDREERLTACWGEVNVQKAAIDGDIATIKARAANANTTLIELGNLMRETDQSLQEGRAAIQRESNRPWGGYAFHYWFDEKVERYRRNFVWAKRLTYLAMRAVEYEFQQSLPLRGAILSAHHPQQLEGAMLALQQERAGRTINRRRPEQSTVVLSLRDDVLHVANHSGGLVASGEKALSSPARFSERLRQATCRIYSAGGQLLGQGMRFSLDKLAAGADSGAALPNRCAERLWRVTATIQGPDLSGSEPGAPAFLLKRNTFASQWCEGLGNGKTLQVAAIQPSRQLFRPDGASSPADEGQSYTAAVIFPWFNVRRTEFFKQSYTEGASEELAGRGLYGDYILLFPQELIDGGDKPDDRGFKLDKVEDVLLRFDYLSVDNLPTVSN